MDASGHNGPEPAVGPKPTAAQSAKTDGSWSSGSTLNGFSSFLDAALVASRASVVEPAPDPRVSAAFALGWQMAELYRQEPTSKGQPAARDDLPGVGRLTEDERAQMALRQIDAAMTKLSGAITTAGLTVPSTADLAACFTPPTDSAERRRIVRSLHVEVLSTLTAADFRLGKAYGLGRSLADTCRNSTSAVTLQAEFRRHRIQKLEQWLDDLASAFPPHAGHSVRASLSRWVDALDPAIATAAARGSASDEAKPDAKATVAPSAADDAEPDANRTVAPGLATDDAQADSKPTVAPGSVADDAKPDAKLTVVGSAPDEAKKRWRRLAGLMQRVGVLVGARKGDVPTQLPVNPEAALHRVNRQGQLWRSLLSGEKSATDMLGVSNYLSAADELLATNGVIAWRYAKRYWYVGVVSVVLLGLGIYLLVGTSGSGTIVAGAGSILASVGLTWKSAGTALGGLGAKVEHELWGAELDRAIADAITILPGNQHDHAGRGNLSATPGEAAAGPVLRPELLKEVLKPQRLLEKIDQIKQQRNNLDTAKTLVALPPEQRLPVDYFDRLAADIQTERGDPHRVISARTPPTDGGPPAPPPVIYLSRRPTVSQFMSVVTHCFENELTELERNVHLGALDHLWRAVEHWTDDLRSRFRDFGPCDVQWIEPKLAQLLADFAGRHAFSTNPAEVTLGEHATVILVGDWATGLPQAQNVAARIRERLQLMPPSTDCHVIHLGDTYYACLEDEVRRRFLDLWPVAPGMNVGSWSLAGNHDMYSGGHSYFDVLLADTRFRPQNRCSYFALRNDQWQILALDSSYKDPDRADLQDPQGTWLEERMRNAGPKTVLLTHHQPFSAYETVDTPLAASVAQALGERQLDAWLWGHEHRCSVFEPNVDDPTTGYNANALYTAVVGHGGVPNLLADQQPGTTKVDIRWEFKDYYKVGADRWGLGGFAVLTFDGPELQIQYFDEYGKERRKGGGIGYEGEAAAVERVVQADDDREVYPPDAIPAPAPAAPAEPRAHTG